MSLALLITTVVVQQYNPSRPVEMYAAPVLAPARVLGMGGAAQALAQGSGGILLNPAAIANRYDYNGNRWFDWDFSLDVLTSGNNVDVENSGRSLKGERVSLVDASLGFNFGKLGVGLAVEAQNIRTCPAGTLECADNTSLQITTTLAMLALAYNYFDGDLVLGGAILVPSAGFSISGENKEPRYTGTSLAAGAIFRPAGRPFRVGSTLRLRTGGKRENAGDGDTVGGRLIPDKLEAPWQLASGVAWGFGEKPMNLRNSFGDKSITGDELLARRYIVVAGDLVFIGRTHDATGRSAWIVQQEQDAGPHLNLSVRAGVESEFWENRMVARAGTYYEPSRFDAAHGRMHGTVGFDLRLFKLIWMWKLTAAYDRARDYQNLSVSVGFWH